MLSCKATKKLKRQVSLATTISKENITAIAIRKALQSSCHFMSKESILHRKKRWRICITRFSPSLHCKYSWQNDMKWSKTSRALFNNKLWLRTYTVYLPLFRFCVLSVPVFSVCSVSSFLSLRGHLSPVICLYSFHLGFIFSFTISPCLHPPPNYSLYILPSCLLSLVSPVSC